jgi:hypothetical protein
MNTDDLASMLAKNAGPADPQEPVRRLSIATGWAAFATAIAMAVTLGVRPDIVQAMLLPMFWMKLGFPALLAWVAWRLLVRLGRPGARTGPLAAVPFLMVAIVWAGAALTMATSAPDKRMELLFGQTWAFCLTAVPLLSIPVFIAALRAMKHFAPVRPALAGAAAGLLASGISAAVYALHCPELTLPFVAAWYVGAMAVVSAAGAMMGRWLLRW